jgi:GGDEF domain-containing protein
MQRFYFLFETLIGLASLVVLNVTFLPAHPAFVDVNPHPYWLIILLVAGRYGPLEGLVIGALTAALYAAWGMTGAALQFEGFGLLTSDFILPIAFLALGWCAGMINKISRRRSDASPGNEPAPPAEPVRLDTEALSAAHLSLIAMRELTLTEFCKKIPGLLRNLLAVQCTSIYLLRNNRLQLQYREDRSGDNVSALPDNVEPDSGVMGEVVRKRRPYFAAPDNDTSQTAIAMSAPLLNRDNQVFGVLNVEHIRQQDMDGNSQRIFEMLAQWIARSIGHVNRERKADEQLADPYTGACSYPYFQKKLRYELARSRRTQTPLTLLLLEVTRFAEMSDKERRNVLIVLDRIFEHTLREIDIICKYNKDNVFAIILPGQNGDAADRAVGRLVTDIDSYQLRPFEHRLEFLALKTGHSVFDPKDGNYTVLFEEAEAQLGTSDINVVHDLFSDIAYLMQTNEQDSSQKIVMTS